MLLTTRAVNSVRVTGSSAAGMTSKSPWGMVHQKYDRGHVGHLAEEQVALGVVPYSLEAPFPAVPTQHLCGDQTEASSRWSGQSPLVKEVVHQSAVVLASTNPVVHVSFPPQKAASPEQDAFLVQMVDALC